MTAHDDPTPLTAAEAAVRARLAEARHTDPVPDDVVARLDAVLADLTADRRDQPTAPLAPVVPLSAPGRRRRALATGLVAAAAVVALGVAVPQVLEETSGGSDGATSASTADRGTSSLEPGPAEDRDDSSGAGGGAAESGPLPEGPGAAERSGSAYAAAVELRSDEALRPAVRLLARRGPVAAYDAGAGCALDVGAGDRVAATWDGRPAVVVLRPAEAGRRVVEVFECGATDAVARTTVRAP
jgi:hypothetical protein